MLYSYFDNGSASHYAASMHNRVRLDALVHQRGLTDSREQAKRLILAGQVLVNGQVVDKASALVKDEAYVEIRSGLPYVSRGGLKLEKALRVFSIVPSGWTAADVGASTGGFTDCLLKYGVSRVYAIDVGYGQLDWELRQNARVVVMERTNARYLQHLPEMVHLVTIDVSFISLRLILPQVRLWLASGGQVVALIKPQFEAGRRQVGKGGVVREEQIHRAVLDGLLNWALDHGWFLWGLTRSPLKGPKGNIEFLAWLGTVAPAQPVVLDEAISRVLVEDMETIGEDRLQGSASGEHGGHWRE